MPRKIENFVFEPRFNPFSHPEAPTHIHIYPRAPSARRKLLIHWAEQNIPIIFISIFQFSTFNMRPNFPSFISINNHNDPAS